MKPVTDRIPTTPVCRASRRTFLKQSALLTAAVPAGWSAEASLARTPTSVRLCTRYDYDTVRPILARMLNEIGGVGNLLRQKHVTVKVNLVNSPVHTWGGLPIELTTVTHPVVAMALGSLLIEHGARRVTFCDQLPFEDLGEAAFARYNYRLSDFRRVMDDRVRFENTRNMGSHSGYDIVKTTTAGYLSTGWEVNKTYTQTDVLVSLTKLKSHVSGGVTLGMKNLFGVPPSSLYGDDLGDEPNEAATGYRSTMMHSCSRKPLTSVDFFTGNSKEGEHGFNVPHCIVDLNAAFPIHLTVIDGISTISNAEGTWMGQQVEVCRPNLLIAGLNPVCTDAVAAHVMGFDADADHGSPPFSNGLNHLRMARQAGLGENRVKHLDQLGDPPQVVRYPFLPTYQRERSAS